MYTSPIKYNVSEGAEQSHSMDHSTVCVYNQLEGMGLLQDILQDMNVFTCYYPYTFPYMGMCVGHPPQAQQM